MSSPKPAFLVVVIALAASSTMFANDWPQWRGPKRDGLASEKGLLKVWPKDGPVLAWTAGGLGKGYASVVLVGDQIFTMGDRGQDQFLIALNRNDGGEKWATKVGKRWDDGGSRCTPTVDGDSVYAESPHGDLVCASRADGTIVWRKDLQQDLGGRMMSGWGFSESPLIDDEKLICTPGGDKAAIAALDAKTGEVIWQADVPDCGGAGYASPVAAVIHGVRQYITLFGKSGGIVSVAAKDGKLLWRHNKVAGGTANVSTPIVKGDLVLYSTGYDDGGLALLRIVRDGKGLKATEVYVKKANELRNHHGGMVLVGDYLFGGHGQNNGIPFCLEFATGKETWKRERGPGSGSAAVVYADGHLYFRYENGVVALIEANPKALEIKSTFQIPKPNGPGWPHPVVVDGKLYLRNQDQLLCYELKPGAK